MVQSYITWKSILFTFGNVLPGQATLQAQRIQTLYLAFYLHREFGRQGRQFNHNYFPGSISTNINNAAAYPGGFTGQQVYGYGSSANNFANGKKKREAQFNQNYHPGSISTNINNAAAYPGGFTGQQIYGYGSSANNFAYGKKKREATELYVYLATCYS